MELDHLLAGAALGGQYARVERYSQVLNCRVYAAIAVVVGGLTIGRVRRGRP